jgi:hypothetical protein
MSSRGLCDGLITRPEESYRVWCVSTVCDHETSTKNKEAQAHIRLSSHTKNIYMYQIRVRMMCCSPQIIYVARDPRDVAASYYHHHRLFFGYSGSCEDFTEALLAEIGKTCDLWFWSSPISVPQNLRDFIC